MPRGARVADLGHRLSARHQHRCRRTLSLEFEIPALEPFSGHFGRPGRGERDQNFACSRGRGEPRRDVDRIPESREFDVGSIADGADERDSGVDTAPTATHGLGVVLPVAAMSSRPAASA
jgi:hypothetical protein